MKPDGEKTYIFHALDELVFQQRRAIETNSSKVVDRSTDTGRTGWDVFAARRSLIPSVVSLVKARS